MPSNDWAVPNAAGQLACGAARQAAVLAAARVQRGEGGRTGGGAMLLCLAGSSHNTFAGGWGAAGKRCTFIGNLMPFCAAIEPSPLSALSALPCRAPCPPSQTFCRCLRGWLGVGAHGCRFPPGPDSGPSPHQRRPAALPQVGRWARPSRGGAVTRRHPTLPLLLLVLRLCTAE